MAFSPPKPYCQTNERQMYGIQSTQASLTYKWETNVWQSVHPSLTVIQMRDKCMAVSPPKAALWPTALKLGCITNFDMLFLVLPPPSIQFHASEGNPNRFYFKSLFCRSHPCQTKLRCQVDILWLKRRRSKAASHGRCQGLWTRLCCSARQNTPRGYNWCEGKTRFVNRISPLVVSETIN